MPVLAFRLATLSLLVDLRQLPGLGNTAVGDDGVRLGALVSPPSLRGYRPELSSAIYVPETVRVLPNKYTVATALAALVELHQNGKRSPCHRAAVIR